MAESQCPYRDAFEHHPLRDPKHMVRLLRLAQRDSTTSKDEDAGTAAIHWNLTTWRLDQAPEYIAVSYTWGDPANCSAILLNGKDFAVRQACWYVLHQAWQHGIAGYLWIDSICINQKDDTEKSAQVAIMGDIYRKAMQINACLGPHEEGSATIFEVAGQYIDYASNVLRRAKADGSLRKILQPMERRGQVELAVIERSADVGLFTFSGRVRAQLQGRLELNRFFHSYCADQLKRLAEAFYAISERSYFERLWIVQELLLARKAIVFCGESLCDFQDLADFRTDLSMYCSQQKSGKHSQDYRQIDLNCSRSYDSIVNVSHGWSGAGMGLLELTDYFADFKCFDERDRIYGMLALVDWKGCPPLLPDYTKSALAVGVQVVTYMCSPAGEEGLVTPQLGSGSASYEQSSHHEWPIVSATRIAQGLGLHSQNSDIQRQLQQRRTQEQTVTPSAKPATASEARARIAVQADSFCQLFRSATTEGYLAACLVQAGTSLVPIMVEMHPDFEAGPGPNFKEVAYRNVLGSNGPCLKVSSWAQPGDYVLSFHSSGFDHGLLARQTEDGSTRCRIIGQAIFDEHTVICSGGEACSCSCDVAWHPSQDTELRAQFDPEDLLLFVCQSLVPNDLRSLDWVKWSDVQARERVREADVSPIGEIMDDTRLLPLRLATSVVQPHDCFSSFVEVEESHRAAEGSSEDGSQLSEQLRELARHFNNSKRRNHA
ncbi:hypothetical protein LTR36_000778 [Oleoguttula mirabilis]|uniref:Heterokaryon incompatibility domain-containing protein n=1 Tax=Oleoguttula mirabilis TaxID=1507867 RepID=A0AAV9J432_9PEZI|nr:hypothetical protein LTR36_000778 [Oleoguttula mirabilis]